jgi:hypothetical protein
LGTIERSHSYCVPGMSERCHFSEERPPPCLGTYPQLHNRLPETMWSYPMPIKAALAFAAEEAAANHGIQLEVVRRTE